MGSLGQILKQNRLFRVLAFAYAQQRESELVRVKNEDLAACGEHTLIMPTACITHPNRVRLGKWTTVQNGTFINSVGGLYVGDYVGIGYRTTIVTFNHRYRNSETIPFDNKVFLQPVIIRDFVWIGWNTCIHPGVEIGEGAIVAMGSVLTKNVPPLAIVMGNPATIIGHRSPEHFESRKSEGRFSPHRGLDMEEILPVMVRKRYPAELAEMGLSSE